MNTTLQNRSATGKLSESGFARACTWIKRNRANARAAARARRALAEIDARTLRDIGVTRRDVAVFSVASCAR